MNQLDRLRTTANAQSRGYQFEQLLTRCLEADGLDVVRNSRAVPGRQNDLLVQSEHIALLIEARWRNSRCNIAQISDMRDRLRSARPGVIGALFSMSGFTEEAVRSVESQRNPEILLFGEEDIVQLIEGTPLERLVDRKRGALLARGRSLPPEKRKHRARAAASGALKIKLNDGTTVPSVRSRTASLSELVLSIDLQDVTWNVARSRGVAVLCRLEIETIDQLRHVLERARHKLGMSSSGAFSIQQVTGAAWFGFGSDHLLRELQNHPSRYAATKLPARHHSEEFAYHAESSGQGLVIVSGRQRLKRSVVTDVELLIWLPGIPVDARRLRELLRELDQEHAYFSDLHGDEYFGARFREQVRLEPIGAVLKGAELVCGLVCRNPFFGEPAKLARALGLKSIGHPIAGIAGFEHVVCSLDDWIDDGEVADYYFLTQVESATTPTTSLVRLAATWNQIVS